MFIVYSKANCAQCTKAEALLLQKGFSYTILKLDVDYSRDDLLKIFPTARTLPQIVSGSGDKIGGFESLKRMIEQ